MGGTGLIKYQLRGRNPAQDSTGNTIWTINATNYVQLTTGTALEVVSSSANDAAAGTGARTVKIIGVDSTYAQFTETITLNGVTPVPLVNTSVIGINKFEILTTGSGLTNAGTVDVRTVVGSTVKTRLNSSGTVGLGRGYASDFLFTVPLGFTAVLKPVSVSGTAVTGDLTAWIRTYNSSGVQFDIGSAKSSLYVTGFNAGICKIDFGDGYIIPEKTLIEGRSLVSAGTSVVIAMADLFLFNSTVWAWPYQQA